MKQKREAAKKVVNPFYKFINVSRVAEVTNINSDKIYNNMKGFYDSMEPGEKQAIVETLVPNISKFFEKLGYTVSFKRASRNTP